MKNIIEITDFSKQELKKLIEKTIAFKNHKPSENLKGKHIALLFDANSLRTKLSFEIAANKLGANTYYIPTNHTTHEKDGTPRECIEDIIETVDRFVDAYVVRDYSQNFIEVLKRKQNPPIINGFSITGHPSQALADLGIIKHKKGKIKGLNIVAICPETGSGVIESFAYGLLMFGGKMTIMTPTGEFKPKNKNFFNVIKQFKGKLSTSKETNIKDQDVLYVDEWWENKKNFDQKNPTIQVNKEFLKESKKELIILHCLPAHHEREISGEVMYSKQSVVFDQAEFRIYSAMAILEHILAKPKII